MTDPEPAFGHHSFLPAALFTLRRAEQAGRDIREVGLVEALEQLLHASTNSGVRANAREALRILHRSTERLLMQ